MPGCTANASPRNSTIKKLPTARTVPRISVRLWVKIAPLLEAMVPALGRLCADAAGADDSEGDAVRLAKSNKLVSTPFLSRNALTFTNCDLMVLLNTTV